MAGKCDPPSNMKFGLGQGPFNVVVEDRPILVQAFGLPEEVTIELLRCEVEKGCYNYVAPVIDPCTGLPAVLTAESPTTTLVAEGAHKLQIVGAEAEDLPEVGVFCYEFKVEASLLLKKADDVVGPAGEQGVPGEQGPPGPDQPPAHYCAQTLEGLTNDPDKLMALCNLMVANEAALTKLCEVLAPKLISGDT